MPRHAWLFACSLLLAGTAGAATTEAPYGSWASPLSAADVAGKAGSYAGNPQIDRGRIYWTELRPQENGRIVLVEHDKDGRTRDVTPAAYSVRTTLSDYGGGDYLVQDGLVVFSNAKDQRLYVQRVDDAAAKPLTPDDKSRWAACTLDAPHQRVFCVHEVYGDDPTEPTNGIAAVPLDGSGPSWVFQKTDFVANPKVDATGTRLAFIAWSHPDMPWDASELRVATIGKDGKLGDAERVAGGKEAISDARFLADGTLVYASDRDGFANLYAWKDGRTRQVTRLQADLGAGVGAQGRTSWAPIGKDAAIAVATEKAEQRLLRVDLKTGATTKIDVPYTTMRMPAISETQIVLLGGSPHETGTLVRIDPATGKSEALRTGSAARIDPALVSPLEAIEFPTTGGRTAYGFYAPPKNPAYRAPAGELPPLIVMVHGGPTGSTNAELRANVQFWTSRGFAVADVNYGGSTGYGRAYRDRLLGKWGVVDVDDVVAAAQYLVAQKKADPKRLIVTGGSAGGYTTLAAMAFRDVFAAGSDLFGVSDLRSIDRDTHKLEKHYTASLIGRGPDADRLYQERSPLQQADKIKRPLIIFQGLEDHAVPPSQSAMIYDAVKKNGTPVAYVTFPEEGHGFRVPANIQRTFENELYFYGKVFGFQPAGNPAPVEITNLPAH